MESALAAVPVVQAACLFNDAPCSVTPVPTLKLGIAVFKALVAGEEVLYLAEPVRG
jgi:hypothetical protein